MVYMAKSDLELSIFVVLLCKVKIILSYDLRKTLKVLTITELKMSY